MNQVLDPSDVHHRGLGNIGSLTAPERGVFLLLDFELLMDMEGWDHFFLYEDHFARYAELKEWLSTIGDKDSLAVLNDYEHHLRDRGVSLEPLDLERFLKSQEDSYFDGCVDWRELYRKLSEQRWVRFAQHLETRGITLRM